MTLKRILEPEVMDTAEEARDYDSMDHSEVNRVFIEDMLKFIDHDELGDVLDVGTGTALIPLELCRQRSHCRVMAIEMAVQMLDLGRYNVEAAGLVERITLAQIDAKAMTFDDGMFDVVMSNSIIHHIPRPLDCLKEMVRVTDEDGGVIFVRDLMRPEDDETVKSLVQIYAGNENGHSQQMFDDSLRAALSLEEIRELISSLGFDSETVKATTDRHWTWAVRRVV